MPVDRKAFPCFSMHHSLHFWHRPPNRSFAFGSKTLSAQEGKQSTSTLFASKKVWQTLEGKIGCISRDFFGGTAGRAGATYAGTGRRLGSCAAKEKSNGRRTETTTNEPPRDRSAGARNWLHRKPNSRDCFACWVRPRLHTQRGPIAATVQLIVFVRSS